VQEFRDRVAVVTGAASGIGFALARRFGAEGMKVVLADIEADALESATRSLEGEGVTALGVETDVTRADSVRELADRTLDAFGGVHVVCNNAGVFAGGNCWESPLEDYEWVIDVNVWGVIHGIRTFVPILLEQGVESHVVNTASMAGITSMPFSGIYFLSKHAVLALSESLYHELGATGSPVRVSALCPELVSTNIGEGERNRPDRLAHGRAATASGALVQEAIQKSVAQGISPDAIAERVLQAIRDERFYILSDDAWRRSAETRMEDIRLGRNPTLDPPVDDGDLA
jgi:NAD(P)-dependent dehydrogenase (short-subunit alcohol dehydrogenase family)